MIILIICVYILRLEPFEIEELKALEPKSLALGYNHSLMLTGKIIQ